MHPSETPSVERLTRALARLRSRARALLLVRRVGAILGTVVAAALLLALVDFAVRLPSGVRLLVWLAGLAAVVVASVRLIVPAIRFRPSLTDMALRVERAHPEVRGLLASALDFAEHGDVSSGQDQSELSRALERSVIERAERLWRDALSAHMLRPAPALKGAACFVVAALVAASPLALSASLWTIGAERVLTPWTDASWPKRTGVADVTGVDVHPLGRAVPLRAALTKSNRSPESTDVFLRYRLVTDGQTGPARRELLTLQSSPVALAGGVEAPLFERLVEPVGQAMEYRFETEDDQTEWSRIRLVEPPAVVFAEAVIVPPDYVAGAEAPTVRVDLGPGTDERGVAPSTLVGSRVALDVRLNKPASLVSPGGRSRADLESLVDPGAATVENVSFEGERLRATLTLHSTLRLPITLIDEHEIRSVDEAVFIFGAAQDNPAGATITEPASDMTVLETAVVEVRAEGRDDVGLDWVLVERQTFEPASRPGSEPSGPGGATEPVGEPVEMVRTDAGGEKLTATAQTTLELATMDLTPGDEIHLTAIAADLYAMEGVRRDPTRSVPRILRIVSQDEFVEEIQAQLSDVRQSAIRIESQQNEVQRGTRQTGASPANRRGQSQVSERVARQVEAVDQLRERVERNRLEDEGLRELLAETRDTLNRAGQAASQAARAMDEAAANEPEAERGDEKVEVPEDVDREQQRALDELAQLIRMLDAGQDTWVVRNTLQRILEEQRRLQNEAGQMAGQTAGREVDELTPGERERLEDIAREQDELAQALDELLQEMDERERALRENDPLAAMGMQAASQRAQRDQTSQTMREASQSASENQMANAGEQQQEAAESLEEMLEDLDAGERKRDEVLRRLLLSIIQSIDALILQQRAEIEALDQAVAAAEELAPLDAGMIALNRNTLGVVGQAREGGMELAQVADLLQRAGQLQEKAITGLRAPEIDAGEVRELEVQSLLNLEEAKRLAEEVEEKLEQQEMERRKRELRRAYREALEKQVALRTETEPFTVLEELSRRDRVRVRRQAEAQEEIRAQLAEIAQTTEEFREARVYAHAHARLDKFAGAAVESLADGDPNRALPRQDAVIATLKSIIASLKDPEPDESDFSDSGSGGGAGGQPAGGDELVSLLGELTLLRSIQQIVAEETVALDQGVIEADSENLAGVAQEQEELADVAEDLVDRLRGGAGTLPPEGPQEVPPQDGAEDEGDAGNQPDDEANNSPEGS